ncbi:MAG: alpha/beta hydrolase [Chitinophagaceae bacterium]|nr:alpha/beta hydrolase [Chitinophagaceae bacterium]
MSIKKKAIIFAIILAGLLLAYYKYFSYAVLLLPLLILVVFFRKIRKACHIFLYLVKLLFKRKPPLFISEDGQSYEFLELENGRKLSYRQFGPNDGWPVFYFHGTPSAGTEAQLIENDILEKNDIRMIAIDRPGIGYSGFQKQRNFSHWVKDVEQVANKLAIDKFSVLGFSGGAGYVAACASLLPERLLSALIVAGAWKMNVKEANEHVFESIRLFWKVAALAPFIVPLIIKSMRTDKEVLTEEEIEAWKHRTTEVDFNFLKENNRLALLKNSVNYAIANVKGVTWDMLMYVREWDIALDKIQFPITLFHGLQDKNVPMALVEKNAAIIPHSILKIYENEGHYSILGSRLGEVIFALTGKEAILPVAVEGTPEEIDIVKSPPSGFDLPDPKAILET